MRLLELFSGTGSVGRAFEALGWEVTSLDVEGEPTIKCDIMDWVLPVAAPRALRCRVGEPRLHEFSKALTRRPRRLEEGDRLVRKTLEIIEHFKPRFWGLGEPPDPAPQNSSLHEGPTLRGCVATATTVTLTGSARGSGAICPSSRGPCASRARAARASGTGATPPGRSGASSSSASSTPSRPSCARTSPRAPLSKMCFECYKALWSKNTMGPVKVFKTPEFSVKQPPDPVVCRTALQRNLVRSVRIREDRSPREHDP